MTTIGANDTVYRELMTMEITVARVKINPMIRYRDVIPAWKAAELAKYAGEGMDDAPLLVVTLPTQGKAVYFMHRLHLCRAAMGREDPDLYWYTMVVRRNVNVVTIHRGKEADMDIYCDANGQPLSHDRKLEIALNVDAMNAAHAQPFVPKTEQNIPTVRPPKHDGRPTLDEVMGDDE